jgi:hypothetical protein
MRSMEDLLAAFAAAEDEAYTLFTYVNDVNAEVEKLEDQVNVGMVEVTKALEQVRRLYAGLRCMLCFAGVCCAGVHDVLRPVLCYCPLSCFRVCLLQGATEGLCVLFC